MYFFCIRIKINYKKKKKKESTYRPSWFSGQKGKQTFYFLGLIKTPKALLFVLLIQRARGSKVEVQTRKWAYLYAQNELPLVSMKTF